MRGDKREAERVEFMKGRHPMRINSNLLDKLPPAPRRRLVGLASILDNLYLSTSRLNEQRTLVRDLICHGTFACATKCADLTPPR